MYFFANCKLINYYRPKIRKNQNKYKRNTKNKKNKLKHNNSFLKSIFLSVFKVIFLTIKPTFKFQNLKIQPNVQSLKFLKFQNLGTYFSITYLSTTKSYGVFATYQVFKHCPTKSSSLVIIIYYKFWPFWCISLCRHSIRINIAKYSQSLNHSFYSSFVCCHYCY